MLIEDLLARAQAVEKPNGCPRPSRRGPHTSIVIWRRSTAELVAAESAVRVLVDPTGAHRTSRQNDVVRSPPPRTDQARLSARLDDRKSAYRPLCAAL